jgi:ankyrin repeat protein
MWATSERHTAVVEELLRRGADVQAGSKTGFTALMFAAQQGDVDIARILIRAGAKPNDPQPKTSLTPLMIASAMGHVKTVELLLDNGADPNHIDARGYAALHLVVRDSDYGIDLKGKDNIVSIVKLLLAHKADPNVRLKQEKPAVTTNEISLQGATPLVLAAEVNNLESAKALLEAGADPLITTEHGTTALMLASGGGTDVQRMRTPEERATAVETAKLLIERGSDVTAVGQYGWTALHAAAYQGLNDVIELLVNKGAKVDEMDTFGQTPLSISLSVLTRDIGARRLQIPRRYRKDVSDLLLKLGATPLAQSGVDVVLVRSGDLND